MITRDRSQKRHYEYNGTRYYSVTQICGQIVGQNWYSDQSSMQRGKDLHDIFALMAMSKRGLANDPVIPDYYAGYCESFRKWMQAFHPIFISVERSDISSMKMFPYAGTPDSIATIRYGNQFENLRLVIEIKTGLPQAWHSVQATAYTYLKNSDCDMYGLLYPDKEGGMAKFSVSKRNDKDWNAFLSALNILTWKESV